MCGTKTASKDEIAAAVEARFPDVIWPTQSTLQEHVADAVAVVVACLPAEVLRLARRMSA
jgi:Holliday junction resolvasome RuvABC endonuclease subunit